MTSCLKGDCSSCPSRGVCSTRALPFQQPIAENFSGKTVIVVMSGKGGVGKSTVAMGMASFLSTRGKTCLIDADIAGPSILRISGACANVSVNGRILPSRVTGSLSVLAHSPSSAGKKAAKNDVLVDLLLNSYLEDFAYVVFDTPPGTTDEHISLAKYLAIDGAVVVSTPQKISIQDVLRQMDFCRKCNLRVLGLIENMKTYVCGACGGSNDLFVGDTLREECRGRGVEYLGSIPLNREIARRSDEGQSLEALLCPAIFEKIFALIK